MNVTPRYAAPCVISRIGVNMPNVPIVQQATMDPSTVSRIKGSSRATITPSNRRQQENYGRSNVAFAARRTRLFVALISQGGSCVIKPLNAPSLAGRLAVEQTSCIHSTDGHVLSVST